MFHWLRADPSRLSQQAQQDPILPMTAWISGPRGPVQAPVSLSALPPRPGSPRPRSCDPVCVLLAPLSQRKASTLLRVGAGTCTGSIPSGRRIDQQSDLGWTRSISWPHSGAAHASLSSCLLPTRGMGETWSCAGRPRSWLRKPCVAASRPRSFHGAKAVFSSHRGVPASRDTTITNPPCGVVPVSRTPRCWRTTMLLWTWTRPTTS